MRTVLATAPEVSLRWSSVRDCARKSVYEATGIEGRERTLNEERQLYRGRSVGHDWVIAVATEKMWKVWIDSGPTHWLPPDLLAASEDEAAAIAELRVQWEMGVGHADLYIRETDTIVEVLSSANPTGDMVRSKLIQARGYARAVDASNLALIIVNPATLEEERVIVTQGSPQWDDLAVECDERLAKVLAWRDTGTLPERACAKPSEAWSHFCVFAKHCFDDTPLWAPPEPGQIDSDQAHTLAERLNDLKAQRRDLSSADKRLEEDQREIQAELDPLMPAAGEWQAGGYRVKRSDRTRKSFKLTLAEEDSRFADELLADFTSVSAYTVWDVEQTGPAAVEDFGDEAPWTAEDLDQPGGL